jgi:hypothetical protein
LTLKFEVLVLAKPLDRLYDVESSVHIVIVVHVRELEDVGFALTLPVVLDCMFNRHQFVLLTV